MPAPDPTQGVLLPTYDDPPAIPDHLRAAFEALMSRAVPRFINTAARDSQYPNPADGQMCITGTAPTIRAWMGQGGEWTETFPLYGPWTTLPPAPGWEPFDGNSWWARQEGEWAATNNVLLRRTNGNNMTLNAGTVYTIGGAIPSQLLPAAGIYGPYVPVVITASSTRVLGMLYWNTQSGVFFITSSATVTLTGGSGSHYIAVPSLRWLLKAPA
jgi:hypothetical protein